MDETIPSRQNKVPSELFLCFGSVNRFIPDYSFIMNTIYDVFHCKTKHTVFSTAMFVYKLLWRHSKVIVIWIPIGRRLPFPLRQKKIVENVIDLYQHVEIDLSRFRQVSNIFCRRLFAFVGNMFPTCWKLVGNLSKTCRRLCRKRVFDMFSTR